MNALELAEAFIQDQDWSKITADWARRRLQIFLTYAAGLSSLTAGQFNRFLAKMRQAGASWSNRNGCYTSVAGFFKWLHQNGHLEQNIFANLETRPTRPRKERKVFRSLALSYIQAIITAAEREDTPEHRRNQAIVKLLITTGMRRKEVAGLAIPDIDFEQREIILRATKYNHERLAFLLDPVATSLKQWLAIRPATDTDRLFISLHPSKNGVHQPLRPDAINKIINKLKKEAGIPGHVRVTPHMFRHTFASEVAKSGNPFALQELLGHSDIKTTEIYVQTDKRELRRVASFAPNID